MQRMPSRLANGLRRVEAPAQDEMVTIPKVLSERVNQLIQGIRPGRVSEQRRHGIADYVRRLIVKCFQHEHKVEAFMFGSVPLRTYLPDGDIDISIFCEARGLQDTWCEKLSTVLEAEAENPEAEYKVKLLKCLIDNIVVDVSFNQIGGLCTLNFLEAMDRKIGGKHLFKKSIILIKAWCYYESRVLGAQHSLLSTYALETMVLHIFNVHHSELETPLEWDHYCLTLSGPIGLKDLDVNSVTVPFEQGKTLLLPRFMNLMLDCYSYTPVIPTNSKGPGYPKYINIMDPLLHSNNLGRSVSKTSSIRIKNAFGYGARQLHNLFNKDLLESMELLDQFFKNTMRAQQRPRHAQQPMVPRQPHPTSYASGNKLGNTILELLKDAHKDMTDNHERDNSAFFAMPPGFTSVFPANGNLTMPNGGTFPPPPPRGPDDKGTVQMHMGRSNEQDRFARMPWAQQVRNPFDTPSTKNDGSPYSMNGHHLMDPQMLYRPQQFYSALGPMKFPSQNNSHVQRNRTDMGLGLQRVQSAPNIGEMSSRKKDKAAIKKYQAPYHVQHPPRSLLGASDPPADDETKPKPMEMTMQRNGNSRETPTGSRVAESSKGSEGRKTERSGRSGAPPIRLEETTVEKLKAMEARWKPNGANNATETELDKKEDPGKETPDTVKEYDIKSETSTVERTKSGESKGQKSDTHESLVVIGESPDPPVTTTGDCYRMDRDLYNARTQCRVGRPVDYPPPMPGTDHPNALLQMANTQSLLQSMNRSGMPDRQLQNMMEISANGEVFAPCPNVIPCMIGGGQFHQPMYNVLTQEAFHSPRMTMPRSSGVPAGSIRHPNMQKMDGHNPLMELMPGIYPSQVPWIRTDLSGMDRRFTGTPVAPGWTYPCMPLPNSGLARSREDIPIRDSDDVLSGDIETLTQHLEVARNFIGCKVQSTNTEKDRNGRSSSAGKPLEKSPPNSNVRKGTPSPTMSNRQDSRSNSRERPKVQEGPVAFPHAAFPSPPTQMGFPPFAPQPTGVVYPMQPTYVGHQPPPPNVGDRMTHENFVQQMQLNVQGATPEFSYQGPVRGMHVPMASVNMVAGLPQGNPPSQMLDANMQLPPQPPRSDSPSRSKDNRGSKTVNGNHPTDEDTDEHRWSVPKGDGSYVQIDPSVYQAVKAAMKEGGEHLSSKDFHAPSNDSLSETTENQGPPRAIHDSPVAHPPIRRQLEEGVVCYTGTKDGPPLPANRLPLGGEFIGANSHMAHLFNIPNPTPGPNLQTPPRPGGPTYGTGGFISMHSHNANEQRKSRDQGTEKEMQVRRFPVPEKRKWLAKGQNSEANGTTEDCSWSSRSGSNNSERAEHTDNRGQARGKFPSSNVQQWATLPGTNRSYAQPARGYGTMEPRETANSFAEAWQAKQEVTSIPNLHDYLRAYGDVASGFVSTEALSKFTNHSGNNYASIPTVSGLSALQGYDFPNQGFPFQNTNLRQNHGPVYARGMSGGRNRRDNDRWIGTRNERGGDRSPTPDGIKVHSLIRRTMEPSERWEGRGLIQNVSNNQMGHRHMEPYFKQGSEEDGGQGRGNMDHLFVSRHGYHRSVGNRHHKNRRGTPEEKNRLKEEDFPVLGSNAAKRPSSPSSPSATHKASDHKSSPASR